MARESNRVQSFWEGFAGAVLWVLKAALVVLALYILFPPFWDAIFAANKQALHEAPYRAADRAVHLWHVITGNAGPGADKRSESLSSAQRPRRLAG
ncbi:MAG: hypothetical protein ACM31P_14070 [Actinomycetota bacterium]